MRIASFSVPLRHRFGVQRVFYRISDRLTTRRVGDHSYLCELAASADNLISSLAWVSSSLALPA